eukprot:TRINITY_DN609_c1_g1_i1.p1 TRINITY_DN609_c1_g1~~TRINITY_DN609_c1_g1_i1.p1  ORF type:complete len:172 (+),score=23.52 TRINITY_DN609_c1_g1_i1:53-517(+)
MSLTPIFVYGTLKRGMHNYERFLKDKATFKCEAETVGKFPLVVDAIGIPYLIGKEGTGHRVKGEIFEVNDDLLVDLDKLEGHPDWYERTKRPVETPSGIEQIWVYMLPKGPNTEVTPMFNDYTPEHHLKYISGENRDGLHKSEWGGYEKREAEN